MQQTPPDHRSEKGKVSREKRRNLATKEGFFNYKILFERTSQINFIVCVLEYKNYL